LKEYLAYKMYEQLLGSTDELDAMKNADKLIRPEPDNK
jgi:hypothetical protein